MMLAPVLGVRQNLQPALLRRNIMVGNKKGFVSSVKLDTLFAAKKNGLVQQHHFESRDTFHAIIGLIPRL